MMKWNECIVFILAKSQQKTQKEFKRLLAPFDLTPIQFLTLALLATENGVSAAEICDRMMIDKSTLSGVLERLEDKGLLTKKTDSQDRRALSIQLTDKAVEMRDQLAQIPEIINKIILSPLSLEEQLLLKRMLVDIYSHTGGP